MHGGNVGVKIEKEMRKEKRPVRKEGTEAPILGHNFICYLISFLSTLC